MTNTMHHEKVIELVSSLVRSSAKAGNVHLKIIYNEYSLEAHDAHPDLLNAWKAIEDGVADSDNGADYILQLDSLLQSRGSDCSLWVTQDGISIPIEKSKYCISMWMSPHQLQQLDRFAVAVGKNRSDAAELLITSGLQIRSLIGETGV